MSSDSEIFRYLPHLKGRIVDPAESIYRTLDPGEIDRAIKEQGLPTSWRRSPESQLETRKAALAIRPDEDLWVFAYGSLMWDPGFHFAEVRVGRAEGYRRDFCLKSEVGRGSREYPGLMAGLDVGGSCEGLVFRISAHHIEEESEVLWRREMVGDSYMAVYVPVETEQGQVSALTFQVDPDGSRYEPQRDQDAAARLIATGKGIRGTNIEYLDNLARQLALLGLNDPDFARLHQLALQHLQAEVGQA